MDNDRDRRRQHDLSRANIVRAQVLFLCSTINDENWEEKLEEFKKVIPSPIPPPPPPPPPRSIRKTNSIIVVGRRIWGGGLFYQNSQIH